MTLSDPVSGRNFNAGKYSDISGSPFLSDNWVTGNVYTAKGVYKGLQIKLDEYSNILYFKNGEESSEFADPVKSFVLTPNNKDSSNYKYYEKGFSGSNISNLQYLQVLAKGALNLYRADSKFLADQNEINRGVVKTFTNSVKYYYGNSTELKPVKLSKKELPELFADKKVQIDKYISDNKLSYAKESDVIQIFRFYNSLN